MKKTVHTPELIVRKLHESDRLIAERIPLAEVMQHQDILHQMYDPYRSRFWTMIPDEVARLATLEF